MGDLVRALAAAIAASPPEEDAFFTQLSGGEYDLRDRIAAHLDAALFESVIASEIRALSMCGTFARLFDLLSQSVAQVASYRWLAIFTPHPQRFGLHAHPGTWAQSEAEARRALGVSDDQPVTRVEDEDAVDDAEGPPVLVEDILLGSEILGQIALARRGPEERQDAELLRVVARELGGAVRIATLIEETQRLAMVDPLTGLLNRRAFIAAVQRELHRMERQGDPICVMLLDVDHFKRVNDERGHPAGDAVLSQLGKLLPTLVRRSDLVGRWGGEEFVVALGSSEPGGAMGRAEAIRAAIAAMIVTDSKQSVFQVTASIGVASCRPGDTVDDLIDRADRAMYRAKSDGRNRVVLCESVTLKNNTPAGSAVDQIGGQPELVSVQ